MNRAGITYSGNTGGFNYSGVLQGTNSPVPIPVAPPPTRPQGTSTPYVNVFATSSKNPPPPISPVTDTSFDWGSFITALTHPPKQTDTGSSTSISDAYAFIPTGLFSIPEPQSAITMPESQKPLYNWGQDAGSIVLSFEGEHPNQPQVLTDFINDRQNPSKIAAMKQLGADFAAVGENISNIDPDPSQMKTAAPALAKAYKEIGQNLAAIPDAVGDEALVKAILTYDTSAEAFVQKFVNVVQILQASGVKYSQNEPGGVFMFPSQ